MKKLATCNNENFNFVFRKLKSWHFQILPTLSNKLSIFLVSAFDQIWIKLIGDEDWWPFDKFHLSAGHVLPRIEVLMHLSFKGFEIWLSKDFDKFDFSVLHAKWILLFFFFSHFWLRRCRENSGALLLLEWNLSLSVSLSFHFVLSPSLSLSLLLSIVLWAQWDTDFPLFQCHHSSHDKHRSS